MPIFLHNVIAFLTAILQNTKTWKLDFPDRTVILIIQAGKFSHELLTKEMPSVFFLTKEGNNHILIFLLYFRQYMFLFVEKLMLLIRYVWNGKCYKTLPALNIFSFCWIMVTWHFFLKKVYRLNDPIKYCLMFDRGNVEIRHKATLLNMASCWYFMFTPSLFS